MNFPEKEIYRLYQDGKTDQEIQKITGVGRKRIGAWRKQNGYPTNPYIDPKRQIYLCLNKTDDSLACEGNAEECAKQLGYKSVIVFYSVYSQFIRNGNGKYKIYAKENNNV